jgi:hypothetical protein
MYNEPWRVPFSSSALQRLTHENEASALVIQLLHYEDEDDQKIILRF